MKKILTVLLVCVFATIVSAQDKQTYVRRKVLVYLKYEENLIVEAKKAVKDSIVNGKLILTSGPGDIKSHGILPYDPDFKMTQYLYDLHPEIRNYLYKDIFLINSIEYIPLDQMKDMGFDPSINSELEPKLNWDSIRNANDTFISYPNIGSVGKFWIIDADWEKRDLDFKPKYLSGRTSPALIFDNYHVHAVRKIYTVTPIDELTNTDGLKIVKDGVLKRKTW